MTHQTTIPWVRRLGALAVMIALMAVFMTVTVQADGPDWKQAPTGLTVTAGDQAGEIDIAWDPHPQTSKTLSDYRVTWTPDGEGFKTNDQTDWYAYPTTNQISVSGPGRRRNLPGQGPGPVRRQPKVGLERRRNRTGWNCSPSQQGPG